MPPAPVKYLPRRALPYKTVELAHYLIGKTLVRETSRGRIIGRIVETEAYLPYDAACHAFNGPTPRNHSLFLERGHAYVYFIYGNHFMLNVSGGVAGIGSGVLLRALEPLAGLELMRQGRGHLAQRDLARGPGRLAAALRITSELDGTDLCASGPLWLARSSRPVARIGRSVRIGIRQDVHRRWRFYERGSPFVSGPKYLRG